MKKQNIAIIVIGAFLIVLIGLFAIKQIGKSAGLSADSNSLEDAVEVQLSNFALKAEGGSKRICETYFYIDLVFRAEDQSTLTLKMPCKPQEANPEQMLTARIPFKHIYSFPPQSGEFTTEATNRVLVADIKDTWPTKWVLETAKFTNETPEMVLEQKASLTINSDSYLVKK